MNRHDLQVLEFEGFLELLGSYACSEAGRARILGLRPATQPQAAWADRGLHEECLRSRRDGLNLPPSVFDSPLPLLEKLAQQASMRLDPKGFLAIGGFLRTVRDVVTFLDSPRLSDMPRLQELRSGLDECAQLAEAIRRAIDQHADGYVTDRASDRLRQIRSRAATLEARIRKTLDRMLLDSNLADAFQDHFVTSRAGRYVVPVKRGERGRIKGTTRDQAKSGKTVFVEPEAVARLGTELENLRIEETDEIRRILGALSNMVRDHARSIERDFEQLSRYDVAYAVSRWAQKYGCHFPCSGDSLRLIRARHPLLDRQFRDEDREDDLVPLDLEVPAGKNVVVITGSNTGGKTVVLKTVGLLTLIGQAGMPIPADEGSSIRFFSAVVADIGDEQSLQQNLSTFSGHLQQVVRILDTAREKDSLALLDELGAGTDPVEGGALGSAILDTLSRTDGLAFATTHLGAIKTFVHGHPKMENAAVSFNVQTLQPEYRLRVGSAGASYAMAIAERFGVPADVLDLARETVGGEQVRLEDMLSAVEQERGDLSTARAAATEAAEAADHERERMGRRITALRRQERKMRREAEENAARLVGDVQQPIQQILSWAGKQISEQEVDALRRELELLRRRLGRPSDEETDEASPSGPAAEPFHVGDSVWVEKARGQGVIKELSDSGKRAVVEVGGMRFETDVRELARRRDAAAGG